MSEPVAVIPAIASAAHRVTAILAAVAMVSGPWTYTPAFAQQEQQQQPQPMQGAPTLGAAQIDQLLAPIALYPDNLVGQILSASTYPLEIVLAGRWSAANPRVTGKALEDAMQTQPWDPSVKALTAVPQVLKMMSEKLEWTQQIGEAYLSQPDDIAAAVQRLRARADASGNLKASEKIKVRRVAAPQPVAGIGPEYIVIEPAVPDVLYVPVYDPWVVYGVWPYPAYRPFYWYPPGYVSVGVIGFGAAIVVGTALWATYNWQSRRVFMDVGRFNTFNRTTLALSTGNQVWQHDPAHRRNQGYSNVGLQTQFGRTLNTTSTGSVGNNPKFFSNTNSNNPNPGNTTKPTGSQVTKFNSNVTINNNTTINTNKYVTGSKTGTFNNNAGFNSNTGLGKGATFNNNAAFNRNVGAGNAGKGTTQYKKK